MGLFGLSVKCLACGKSYGADYKACPRCAVPKGATALPPVSDGGPRQLMRVYKGNHATREFEHDQHVLARIGWVVTSQSAGGYNALKIGKRMPTMISVTYGRVA